MQICNSKKYFRVLAGARFLTAVALLFLVQSPAFSMGMWEQLLEEQLEEANSGDAEAQYGVGIKYLNGQGVKQDRKEAKRWLKQAAASGHEAAQDKLDRLQSQQKDFEQCLVKAQAGDLKSQYQAGIMYLKGKGVDMNGDKARSWISKAADRGDQKAITRLGILYYKGEGGATDYKRAFELLNSVSNNSVLAQYYLGEMYAGGKGVERSFTTAIDWYTKATDGGFKRASGKIINMQEEIKMEKRRKINMANKKKSIKAAETRVVAQKQLTETKRQEEAVRLADARKLAAQRRKKAAAAAAARKPARLTPLEKLAGKQWERNQKQVSYLPSKVTECEMENSKLVCFSGLLTRTSGSNTVHYRVKSDVSSVRGIFYITYRNLVVDVINIESDDEELLGYGDEKDQGFRIQTGWTQDHKVECRSNQKGELDCIKDQTHKMVIAGK